MKVLIGMVSIGTIWFLVTMAKPEHKCAECIHEGFYPEALVKESLNKIFYHGVECGVHAHAYLSQKPRWYSKDATYTVGELHSRALVVYEKLLANRRGE